MTQPLIEELSQAVIDCDPEKAEAVSRLVLKEGVDSSQAMIDGAVKGIRKVGELFGEGTYFLPELMMATQAVSKARAVLEPDILKQSKNLPTAGSILMGAVQGDLHDIGYRIVAAYLRAEGFEVTDLGKDAQVSAFVQKAKELDPDIIGLSALLTVTMPFLETTAKALREAGVSGKIIIGGAPVTQEFADEIGVSYAENAAEACIVCRKLMEGKNETQAH